MSSFPTVVAFIPARAGSKRVEAKNVRLLAGHPLLAYSISAALESGIYSSVIVSTDSEKIADIAKYYGAEVPFLRPPNLAEDLSPDIGWVEHTIRELNQLNRIYDCFSILRPTSPFRQVKTIQRAWNHFLSYKGIDSMRAVEKCKQHPGKMWIINGNHITPLLQNGPNDLPWHSTPYQGLPDVFVQNASLEIAWTNLIDQYRTIAGKVVAPFFTEGNEGFDINDLKDWWYAEHLLQKGDAKLPTIKMNPITA